MTHRPSLRRRMILAVLAVLAVLPMPPVVAQAPPVASAAASEFATRILAGGASNALIVEVQPADLARLPTATLRWLPQRARAAECSGQADAGISVLSKAPDPANHSRTVLTLYVPPPPCRWPPYQYGHITVTAAAAEGNTAPARILFDGALRVSVLWFPLLITLAAVGFIYPGCAMIAWRAERRRANRNVSAATMMDVLSTPSLWKKLDPVQITANMWGRASLPKLQIFSFSLIVFGLLLYYQVRNGILSGLSEDVLILLGISAVGTAGGRYTHSVKRRLSLESWAWLRRKGWLPSKDDEKRTSDVASRATWGELITDTENKEFDVYSFQMAIFSVVVAASLMTSSLTGLATFEIPDALLGLLGLSQAVFITGKAMEKSPFAELEAKLASVRANEKKFQESIAQAAANPDARTAVTAARDAFRTDVGQAANMFWALYCDVLPVRPKALDQVAFMEPETAAPLPIG
jgi:hypothetical protein